SATFLSPRHISPKSAQVVKNYPGTCSATDQTKTKGCLDSYFSTYGIDSSKGLPPYYDYIAATSSVVMMYGVAGFDVYCDFEKTLESCLGGLMTSPCMNPQGFVDMYGLEMKEAIDYATTYPVDAYTCQNIDLVKHYYPCMVDMTNDHYQ
ncbi:hypothetical protein PENTCL1PPCAC_14740, partial [Pristionchus entomophagus]